MIVRRPAAPLRLPILLLALAWVAATILGVAPRALAADDESWTTDRPPDADLPRFSLDSISFEGTFTPTEDELRDAIKSSTSGLLRFRPVNLERLEGDVLRLRNFLRRGGWWNPRIRLQLLFEAQKRKTRATFEIEEGVRRHVGNVRVEGNQTFDRDAILGWTTQRKGSAFDLAATDRDRTEIENRYANEGFYLVEVVADIQSATEVEDPIVHDLVYAIHEGPRFFVGEITVAGNEFTEAEIVRRELTIRSGEVLSREKLLESRARLYATGYFSRVDLVPQEHKGGAAGRLDLLVNVVERTMRFVGAGIGYGTRDQLRLSGEWGHRNLWGHGKRATIRGLLATELFPVGLVRSRIEGRYVEPWLFRTRTTGTGEVFFERGREFFREAVTNEEGEYDLSLVGLSIDLNRAITRQTRGWISLENEWADLDPRPGPDPPDDARPDLTRTITFTLERDRRNDYFDPGRGFLNRVTWGFSGGVLGGDNDFWRSQVEMAWFEPLRGGTLAGRIRVGYEEPFGASTTIDDRQRFKIGGATTVRGYREQEIGAGDFLLLGNIELRFPMFWVVDGGVFFDAGNAWPQTEDVDWSNFSLDTGDDPDRALVTEVRYSTGAGVRVATPVGPVRLDWGWKLKILPVDEGKQEEDHWRFHLSLGHVF